MAFLLLLSNLFCPFQIQKTLHTVVFTMIKTGSGSALKKQLNPDSKKMNADPQPYFKGKNCTKSKQILFKCYLLELELISDAEILYQLLAQISHQGLHISQDLGQLAHTQLLQATTLQRLACNSIIISNSSNGEQQQQHGTSTTESHNNSREQEEQKGTATTENTNNREQKQPRIETTENSNKRES